LVVRRTASIGGVLAARRTTRSVGGAPHRLDGTGRRIITHTSFPNCTPPMSRAPSANPQQRRSVGKTLPAARRRPGVAPSPLGLPHERDETTMKKEHPVDPVIEQARDDVERGLVDTDLRERAGEVFRRRWGGRRQPT
jgi:hypothetical protein